MLMADIYLRQLVVSDWWLFLSSGKELLWVALVGWCDGWMVCWLLEKSVEKFGNWLRQCAKRRWLFRRLLCTCACFLDPPSRLMLFVDSPLWKLFFKDLRDKHFKSTSLFIVYGTEKFLCLCRMLSSCHFERI